LSPIAIALAFLIIWWVVWFMALPFGVKPPAEPGPGHVPSAPEKPMLARKAIITTVITAVLVAIIAVVVAVGGITLDDIGG
jgi:predicted secreted protein